MSKPIDENVNQLGIKPENEPDSIRQSSHNKAHRDVSQCSDGGQKLQGLSDRRTRVQNVGVILANIGSPSEPTPAAVRTYLRQFLMDPFVVDLPWLLRFILVQCVIAPFRAFKSAKAYGAVWGQGTASPLVEISQSLRNKLQLYLDSQTSGQVGSRYYVKIAMRYGEPSFDALPKWIEDNGITSVKLLPLYPQYAASATTSSIKAYQDIMKDQWLQPQIDTMPPFFDKSFFLDAAEAIMKKKGIDDNFHVLFSYHGLPERHLNRGGLSCAGQCLNGNECLLRHSEPKYDEYCYKRQCFKTTQHLVQRLGLKEGQYSMGFQSRLGRTPWIKPYTDEILTKLAQKGVKHLKVVCPSFAVDCLETLEEIAIRAREQFLSEGGESLELIPCVNDSDLWVRGLGDFILGKGL